MAEERETHSENEKAKLIEKLANEEIAELKAELSIAKKQLGIQNRDNEKLADEIILSNKERDRLSDELIIANRERDDLADELEIACKEKDDLADELKIANKEKDDLADELTAANNNLSYEHGLKEKREEELTIASEEKSKQAAELTIANVLKAKLEAELLVAHIENAKRSSELAIAQREIEYHKSEEKKRSAELISANIEKAKIAAELVVANIEKAKLAAERVFISKGIKLSQEKEKLSEELAILKEELSYEIEKPEKFAEILEREESFQSLAESLPQIIWTTRADGWCTYFNHKWVDYTGLSHEESYGHGWNIPIHPEDRQAAWETWQNAIANKTEYSIECRLRRYDDTYHWWLIRGAPKMNAKGEISMWIGTCTDIEKIKETELALKQSEEQLLRLNADKDRFISVLGHDLKNPFTTLIGISELLVENIRVFSIDKTEVLLNHLRSASIDTFALLEDLLSWTNSQSGIMPFEPQIHHLSEIFKNVLEILNIHAGSKNIGINVSVIDNIYVFADINMLKTILRNLISNAIKFTNKGGTITIKAWDDPENVTISVSDNGIGILPEKLTNLFNIFHRQTTRGTDKESGTGMGLILCKEFVERHGGKIWVESKVGSGSDFKFTIPVTGINR